MTEIHGMLQKNNANHKELYETAMEQLNKLEGYETAMEQLNNLEEEMRKVSTELKTAETKLADTTKASLKWEYDYKRSEEERETIEQSIEGLR